MKPAKSSVQTHCRSVIMRPLRRRWNPRNVRSPDERPSFGARYPGPTVPHVAISREERDLAHAGYEVHVLKLTAMRATRGSKDQLRDGTHYKHTIRGFINVDWQIYLCASALL